MTNDPGSEERRSVGGIGVSKVKPVAASLVMNIPVFKSLIRFHVGVFKFVQLEKSTLQF